MVQQNCLYAKYYMYVFSPGDQVTMATVAGRFLSGAPCQELKALQSAIVSEILDQLAGLITKAGWVTI